MFVLRSCLKGVGNGELGWLRVRNHGWKGQEKLALLIIESSSSDALRRQNKTVLQLTVTGG